MSTMAAGNAKSLELKPRVARIGNDLLKRQVDDVHENVFGDARNEMGSAPSVSVQAWFVRPSGLCFLGVRVKPKRNGYFPGCHWETLAPRPPEYSHEQEGPVQFQWVKMYKILSGDRCFGKPGTIYINLNHVSPLRKRGRDVSATYSPNHMLRIAWSCCSCRKGAVRTIRTNLKFSLHFAPSLQAAAATQRERRSGSA